MNYINLKKNALKIFLSAIYNSLSLIFSKIVVLNFGPQGLIVFNNFRQIILVGASLISFNRENIIAITIKNFGFSNTSIKNILVLYKQSFYLSIFMIFVFFLLNLNFFLSFSYIFFKIIAFFFTVYVFALNSILFSILNGLNKLIQAYVFQIIASISALLFLFLFILLKIDLSLMIVNFFLILSLTLLLINSFYILKISNIDILSIFRSTIFSGDTQKISIDKNSLYVFTVFVVGNLLQIFVRSNFISKYTIEKAGYIDGLFTLSNYFSGIIISFLTMNFLVDMTRFKNNNIRWLKKLLTISFLVLVIFALFLFLLAENILMLLYSNKFTSVARIYKYFIIGDIFKILCGLLMLVALAFEKYKQYFQIAMFINILTLIPYLVLNFDFNDSIGVFYAISNLFCFILIYFYTVTKSNIFNQELVKKVSV